MQVCTLLQSDNHASTPPLSFLQAGCPSCRPTNSVKALKAFPKIRESEEKKKKDKWGRGVKCQLVQQVEWDITAQHLGRDRVIWSSSRDWSGPVPIQQSTVQRHQSAKRPISRQISSLVYPKIQRRQVIMYVLHPSCAWPPRWSPPVLWRSFEDGLA